MDSKEWDEQQGGAGQPSVRKKQTSVLETAGLGSMEGRGPVTSPSCPSVSLFTDCLVSFTGAGGLGTREPTSAQGS